MVKTHLTFTFLWDSSTQCPISLPIMPAASASSSSSFCHLQGLPWTWQCFVPCSPSARATPPLGHQEEKILGGTGQELEEGVHVGTSALQHGAFSQAARQHFAQPERLLSTATGCFSLQGPTSPVRAGARWDPLSRTAAPAGVLQSGGVGIAKPAKATNSSSKMQLRPDTACNSMAELPSPPWSCSSACPISCQSSHRELDAATGSLGCSLDLPSCLPPHIEALVPSRITTDTAFSEQGQGRLLQSWGHY